MSLLDLAVTDNALINAWSRVKENGGVAGADGVSLARFGEDLPARLGKLRVVMNHRFNSPRPLAGETSVDQRSPELNSMNPEVGRVTPADAEAG